MEKVGIFYGSSTGNTQAAAEMLQAKLDNAELHDVASDGVDALAQYKNIIIGASTWGVGDLQDDMEGFVSDLSGANLAGKRVAVFGMGDQSSYSDTYCDGMGHIHEALENTGCERVGDHVSTDGYEHDASISEVEGVFIGLPLDADNQDDLTEDRIDAWVEVLKGAFY